VWDNPYDTGNTNPTPEPASLKNGLVAYYPLNGNVEDVSGNGKNGIPNGILQPTVDRNNKSNSACYFNSSEFTSNINSSNFNQDFTISMWVQLEEFTNQYAKLIWGQNFITLEFLRDVSPRVLTFFLYNPNVGQIGRIEAVVDFTAWNHIVISNSGGYSSLYLNGSFIIKSQLPRPAIGVGNSNFLKFGNALNDSNNFKGKMDEIRIYNRALTQEEITYLANN
jgi:hypothetical protein